MRSGWPESYVHALGFRRPYGSNIEHAAEIASAAAELQDRTGVERIAVVAHSMGGLAVRAFLAEDGAAAVETVVFVATPHKGTWLAWLGWGDGAREMRPGNPFLRGLGPVPPGVRAVCIRTPAEFRVVPGSSARLDGIECLTVRAPTHPRMMHHRGTLELIRTVLHGSDEQAREEGTGGMLRSQPPRAALY
ncbi:MAG TPA: alpha/beta fold hydrolase [Longimicrobiales bacterium]|nr:alpha/beta fold hydrolase [Longimicrobiales bacterium]